MLQVLGIEWSPNCPNVTARGNLESDNNEQHGNILMVNILVMLRNSCCGLFSYRHALSLTQMGFQVFMSSWWRKIIFMLQEWD